MLLFQFSAAKGPDECCLAVAKALKRFLQDAIKYSLEVDILASQSGDKQDTLHSVLLSIKGEHTELLTNRWQGSIQWVCQSPYRPSHKRKNWYIGAMCLPDLQPIGESEIQFTTTKSSGAGGQHVNKTESAVRATHMATGISVKVQSQRSQHANKRLAAILLAHKLADLNDNHYQQHKAARHQFHQQIERGKR